MGEQKLECTKCGASILKTTADENNGRCKACVRGAVDPADVAEAMEFGMRTLMGAVFAIVFAGIGYGLGVVFGTFIAVVTAIPFAIVGFIYGFFSLEINSIIRSWFSVFIER